MAAVGAAGVFMSSERILSYVAVMTMGGLFPFVSLSRVAGNISHSVLRVAADHPANFAIANCWEVSLPSIVPATSCVLEVRFGDPKNCTHSQITTCLSRQRLAIPLLSVAQGSENQKGSSGSVVLLVVGFQPTTKTPRS
jgi:hypothetical protein